MYIVLSKFMFLYFKKYLAPLMSILISLSCVAQNNNIWHFGRGGAIDFNQSPPKPIVSLISTLEGCSSVADDNGNLLFYTDGITVWNSSHRVMKNGSGLLGNTSSTQSSIVVRKPGKDSIYYIFNGDLHTSQVNIGIHFSILDMKRDSGLGEVIVKNSVLYDKKATEKIAVVKASELCGFWIITHDNSSSKFNTFFLDEGGLNLVPITSDIGFDYSTSASSTASIGYLVASPDGNKLAAAMFINNGIELYDFDKKTGKITSAAIIDKSSYQSYYGCCFSPNSKYLYSGDVYNNNIFQHDVSLNDVTKIKQSKKLVASNLAGNVGALQLGPDGKIYVVYSQRDFLGAIERPNEEAGMVSFRDKSIVIFGEGNLGLPSFINSQNFQFTSKLSLGNDTVVCSNKFNLTTNKPTDKHLWFTGDTNSQITVYESGNYWAEVTEKCGLQVDTISIIIIPDTLPQVELGDDAFTCDSSLTIKANNLPDVKYLWNTNDTLTHITIKKNGTYNLRVSNVCYSRTDTIKVGFLKDTLKNIKIGNDTLICSEEYEFKMTEITGAKYLWNTGEKTNSIHINKSGKYWARLTAPICNTYYYDTINVVVFPTAPLNIGNDIEACKKDLENKILKADAKYVSYLWHDGSTQPTYKISDGGIYTLSVTDTCGTSFTKSININLCDCQPYIPTSYTPNNDGVNDDFEILNFCTFSVFDLKIFNRWGEVIFQSQNPNAIWDGTYKGKPAPEGVYMVTLRYGYAMAVNRNANYKGIVTLIR